MDKDFFKFYLPQRGVLTVAAATLNQAQASYTTADYGTIYGQGSFVDGRMEHRLVLNRGEYFARFTGYPGSGGHSWTSYNHANGFCPLPELPTLTANGPTAFCEGESVTLTTTDGYEEYQWFRDGARLAEAGRTLVARQGGAYTCEGVKCGIPIKSTNAVSVTVTPAPLVPTMALDAMTRQLTSSSPVGNQWLLGGAAIGGAMGQTLPDGSLGAGSYTVQVTVDGCRSTSAPFVVTGLESVVANGILISPNPATTRAMLEGLSGQVPTRVSIYSAEGKLVRNLMVPVGVKAVEVDLRDFRPALYLFKIQGNEQVFSTKLLVN